MLALPTSSRMAALLRSPFFSSSTTTSSSSSPAPTLGICLSAVPSSSSSSAFPSVIAAAALPRVSRSALFSSAGFLSESSSGSRLLAFSSGSVAATRGASMGTRASTAATAPTAKSVHEFTVTDINGEEVDLSKFKGKVLLIVNVASACGLTTGNYTELAEVYSRLRESGLEILAFPCNQFGGQESGTNEQIKAFACTRFKAEYPIFDKIDVNGPKTAPLYQFLKASKGGGILGDSIKWNFAKFLVNQDGIVIERYAPTTSPKKIEADIKKLLGV